MRFLITVVCVIALFGAVYAQDRCELCKEAVDALGDIGGAITERRCQDTVSEEARDMCSDFASAADLISDALRTTEQICETLNFCTPPASSSSHGSPISNPGHNFVTEEELAVAKAVVTVGAIALYYVAATALVSVVPVIGMPMVAAGRRKRDLDSTERNVAGIYGEEKDNPFEYMDPTLNPSSDLPEEMDAFMKQAASSLKCELCKLGISIDSSNATLLQTGQGGAPIRTLLCRSLPEKRDQRKCITVLRQASEIFLPILGSIFDSLETCEGLKSCQVG